MNSIVIGLRAQVVIILISGSSGFGSRSQVVLYTLKRTLQKPPLSSGSSSWVDQPFAPRSLEL